MIHDDMRKIFVFCMIVTVFAGCHKEKELLTGDVMGKITVYNQDLTTSLDNSGVEVSLYNENTLLETTLTDARGQYRFEDFSYGKYSIDLQKEKFFKEGTYTNYSFNHVGGYSPSIVDGAVYKVPDYNLIIDSVKPFDGELYLYVKIDGSSVIPFLFYCIIGYSGNDPTVSKDNYSYIISGVVMDSYAGYPIDYHNANGVMRYLRLPQSPDKVYTRFYLLTNGQSPYNPINKEALGKPSNVVSFIWH
jgi:hypothetical protein